MGDDGIAGPPAKKRGATRQIAKDDSSDSEGESFEPSESGSFKKAPEEVIASRRIVKVRRGGVAQMPPAPNPFAAIRLVVPATSSGAPPVSSVFSTPLAPSAEPIGEAAGEKKEVTTALSKDAVQFGEVQKGKGEAEVAGDSVEAAEVKMHRSTAALDEPESENGEGKLEMPKSPKAEDDPKRNEEVDVKGEGVILSNASEPANTSTADMGSEGVNSGDSKSQAADGGKQDKEDKELEASEQGDASKGVEFAALATANTLDNRSAGKDSLPPLGAATAASFSFGTAPALFETPTAFASFSSSWASFGSGTASGTSLGSGFAFGKVASEGAFASASSPFGNSNGSSFQLFNTSSSTPLNTGPPPQPPASAVQFQGGITPTGEEEEKMVFGADATLFEFIDAGWKERGKGELRVNLDKMGKARLLMRSKGNFRLILNASLFPDMKTTSMDSRGVTFACVNSAVEEKSGLATYALKFKDSLAAGNFRDVVDAHKCPPQEGLNTPENSPSSLHGP